MHFTLFCSYCLEKKKVLYAAGIHKVLNFLGEENPSHTEHFREVTDGSFFFLY